MPHPSTDGVSAEIALDARVIAPLPRHAGTMAQPAVQSAHWIRCSTRTLAVVLGGLSVWATRHNMNVDGTSYLDMGDAFMRGDWAQAINGHWSPLYAWLLGLVAAIVDPGPYWEFTLAHAVNFAIFLAGLAAFELLLLDVLADNRARAEQDGRTSLPDWAWLLLGHALFLWSALHLITLSLITPDLAVAAILYLSAALVLRIRRGAAGTGSFLVLGAALGGGFLIKAPLFVLAFLFLGLAAIADRARRQSVARTAIALALFVALAGPFVVALSLQKGRPTFGDSRTASYAWLVAKIPMRHWQGDDTRTSPPIHPTRRVLDHPAVYEFATPVGGTYPVWFDPSYWGEGVRAHFDLRRQVEALVNSARHLYGIFLVYLQSALVFGFLVLALTCRPPRQLLADLACSWPLLVPALAGLAMFSLVEALPRYVGPFVVLLWLGLFSGLRFSGTVESRRLVGACSVVMLMAMAAVIGVFVGPLAGAGARDLARGETAADHPQWQVADRVHAFGIAPGSRVAEIHAPPGRASWSGMTSWARLARVRIVAEVPPESSADYWQAPATVQSAVMSAFRQAGAVAVVTANIPDEWLGQEWRRLGDTNFYIYGLAR